MTRNNVVMKMFPFSKGTKATLIGVLLTAIILGGSIGAYNALFAIPKPDYRLPDLPVSTGWDFTSGLTLSSNINKMSDNLVYFSVSDDTTHFNINPNPSLYGYVSLYWGILQPQDHNSDIALPLSNNDYSISFNVQTTGVMYEGQSVNKVLKPADLQDLSQALTLVLASDSQFEQLTEAAYLQGIQNYFSQFDSSKSDELRITHGYNDGVFIGIRVLGDNVFITYQHMSTIHFQQDHSLGSFWFDSIPDSIRYYKISIHNLNLQPYFDYLNYMWYSYAKGG